MYPLADLQRAFGRSVLDHDGTVHGAINGLGLDPAQRMSIHRNNTFITLTEALAATFPVIHRLVGEAFFAQTARDFIRAHPPASGCLMDLGVGFPAYLETYPPALRLPYLPDVAALEWAWHRVLNDTDEPPLDPATLGEVAPELLPMTRFTPILAARLVSSPWPVASIWRANQPEVEDPPVVDLHAGPERVLVLRPGVDVLFADMTPGEAVLWRELELGAPLGEAATLAEATDGDFDLGSTLGRLFAVGAFAAFSLPF